MIFDSLKEKCEYYRSLGERRMMPNGHIIMMLDGRSFSKLIKNKFEKPFDETFIKMMNKTAEYLCENISGVRFAYVQSDEISLYIKDEPAAGSFFGLRTTKLLSIAASLATGKFNQLYLEEKLNKAANSSEAYDIVKEHKPAQFDCKVWNVPNENDVYAWFLYRQIDCIRNSKQQTAQTWLSHGKLSGKDSDEQILLLKEEKGIDWNTFKPEYKQGRLVQKTEVMMPIPPEYVKDGVTTTMRTVWKSVPMPLLTDEIARMVLIEIINKKSE